MQKDKKYIIATFDCGCKYETLHEEIVIVEVLDPFTEMQQVITKLEKHSCYSQCEPLGYDELIIVIGKVINTNGNILTSANFLEKWEKEDEMFKKYPP